MRWFTAKEICEITGVSRNTPYNWWRKYQLSSRLVKKAGDGQFDELLFSPEFAVLMLARRENRRPFLLCDVALVEWIIAKWVTEAPLTINELTTAIEIGLDNVSREDIDRIMKG